MSWLKLDIFLIGGLSSPKMSSLIQKLLKGRFPRHQMIQLGICKNTYQRFWPCLGTVVSIQVSGTGATCWPFSLEVLIMLPSSSFSPSEKARNRHVQTYCISIKK